MRSCVTKTQRKRVNKNDYLFSFAFQHRADEGAKG